MNQKELYIQYLEDALNHAKTGEPMKHWQIKCDDGTWENLSRYLYVTREEYLELRIKPDPFKWTAFAYISHFGNLTTGTVGGHVEKENIAIPVGSFILTVHHHKTEIE